MRREARSRSVAGHELDWLAIVILWFESALQPSAIAKCQMPSSRWRSRSISRHEYCSCHFFPFPRRSLRFLLTPFTLFTSLSLSLNEGAWCMHPLDDSPSASVVTGTATDCTAEFLLILFLFKWISVYVHDTWQLTLRATYARWHIGSFWHYLGQVHRSMS